jgi:hypothetical protein
LPWGTLLQSIVKPPKKSVEKIKSLLKKTGEAEMIIGYNKEFEPSETDRLKLPKINGRLIETSIKPVFEKEGLELTNWREVPKGELKNLETTWGKKLGFAGKERPIFQLTFETN